MPFKNSTFVGIEKRPTDRQAPPLIHDSHRFSSLTPHLAVAPMVREARGRDAVSAMIATLSNAGNPELAVILQRTRDDEIGHVAIGKRRFEHICAAENRPPDKT